MRTFFRKLLTTGVPVAVVSGVLGYGLAGFAGTYADAQAALLRGNTDVPSERMKVRIPLLLAGMSFSAVVALEGLAALFRGNRPAAPPAAKARAVSESGLDAEVEALLNGILAQTEADRLAQTPPAVESEASGTGGPRNLSTTH